MTGDVEKRGKRYVFQWEPVKGAQGYHVQVARSLLFSPRVAEVRSRSPRPTAELRGLPEGQFYWRVAAMTSDGSSGAFSEAQPLVLRAPRRASIVMPLVDVTEGAEEPAARDEKPMATPQVPSKPVAPAVEEPVVRAPAAPPVPTQPRTPRRRRAAADIVCSCLAPEGPATVEFQWDRGGRRRLQVSADTRFRKLLVDRNVGGASLTLPMKPGRYVHRWAPSSSPSGKPAWSAASGLLIRCDERAPAIRLDAPPSRLFTLSKGLVVQGSTEPGAHMLLNDHALSTDDTGAFQVNVALAPGLNIIHLLSTDAMGNETHRTVHATMDSEAHRAASLERLGRLQQRLNALDARRSDVERSAAALLANAPREHRAALLELTHLMEPEFRGQRALKQELSTGLGTMMLELQPTPGVKVPAPDAVLVALPAPRPDAPPPLPPRE